MGIPTKRMQCKPNSCKEYPKYSKTLLLHFPTYELETPLHLPLMGYPLALTTVWRCVSCNRSARRLFWRADTWMRSPGSWSRLADWKNSGNTSRNSFLWSGIAPPNGLLKLELERLNPSRWIFASAGDILISLPVQKSIFSCSIYRRSSNIIWNAPTNFEIQSSQFHVKHSCTTDEEENVSTH